MRRIHVLGCLSAIALTACAGADAGETRSAAEVEDAAASHIRRAEHDGHAPRHLHENATTIS